MFKIKPAWEGFVSFLVLQVNTAKVQAIHDTIFTAKKYISYQYFNIEEGWHHNMLNCKWLFLLLEDKTNAIFHLPFANLLLMTFLSCIHTFHYFDLVHKIAF